MNDRTADTFQTGPVACTEPTGPVVRWVVPGWRDVRWGQIAILAILTLLGQVWLNFAVSPLQIVTAILTAVVVDMAWSWHQERVLIVPASALITGLGLGLLLRSPDLAPFVIVEVIAMSSKHLIRYQGKHIFNPGNFGLVICLAFTNGLTQVTPGQWGTSGTLVLLVLCVGLFLSYSVGRLRILAFFFTVHLVVANVGQALHPSTMMAWHGMFSSSVFPASILIFGFFMLSDPRTSPRTAMGGLAYATAVAVLGEIFTLMGSPAGTFVALVGVCAAVPAFDRFVAHRSGGTVTPFVWDAARLGAGGTPTSAG
jgi:Na+-transporting NADH:ubiquinone oxidoreductase subunit NqrB